MERRSRAATYSFRNIALVDCQKTEAVASSLFFLASIYCFDSGNNKRRAPAAALIPAPTQNTIFQLSVDPPTPILQPAAMMYPEGPG